MKKIMIIACFLVVNMLPSFAQNKGISETAKVEKVLAVYKSEAQPYLQEMVDREYPKGDDILILNVKLARLHGLEAHGKVIKKDVYRALAITKNMESMPKSRLDSIPYIDVLVKMEYQRVYPGLPYEFYKKASDKANENL